MIDLVDEKVEDLLEKIDATIIEHGGDKWMLVSELRYHFPRDKSNLGTRQCRKYCPEVFVQLPWDGKDDRWFVRNDYIPWVVTFLVSDHGIKSEAHRTAIKDFLYEIGIRSPESW